VSHRVTLIRGDGIGPEVTSAAVRTLEATGVAFDWDVQAVGAAAIEAEGVSVPQRVVDSIATTRVALKGPVATPTEPGFRAPMVTLRAALDLHLGIRPCRSFAGVPVPLGDVDLVVVRMTGEDLYAGIEFDAGSSAARELAESIVRDTGVRMAPDAGFSIKMISTSASTRAARTAFEYARRQRRRRVTVVHKANVMRSTDGLFVQAARAVAPDFPELEYEERLVDSVSHDLVTRPETLDVLFTSMLYGDILSDICAGLIGGLGLAPGVSMGDECAVFETAHGTAPRLSGQNRANPMAAILSGALMLRHLGEDDAALRLESAVGAVLESGRTVTYDVRPGRAESGAAGTSEVTDAVVAALDS
jgi:isocitrate dehydrogenase (NAD+)